MNTNSINSLFSLLSAHNNDFSNHDLAVLADWAHAGQKDTPNPDWKRAYALIREGADLLLRRRARSSETPDVPALTDVGGLQRVEWGVPPKTKRG
jgi:hypothetical protein